LRQRVATSGAISFDIDSESEYHGAMNRKGKILLALAPDRVPANAIEQIRDAGDGRDVIVRSGKSEIEGALEGVEIVAGDFPASLLLHRPTIKWFQLWYAGADWLQKIPGAADLPVMITTASGVHGEQMTEHLFGLLFAWNRRFPRAFAAQARHEWAAFKHSEMATLAGKTMLILGYGTIGERVARAAEVFGMKVIGVRRTSPAGASATGSVRIESYAALPSLLPQVDLVVNILPFTEETRGLFGEREFSMMKRTALYANIGRGATVDETALVDALSSGAIAGAVLDVASEEPLPASSPLWDLPNVILTSHYSGFHPRYDELVLGVFLDNLGRYVRGEELRNVVDKKLGY
jgi:phosphoglycerate dehydrogenase-like enzyme